jgi:hypothetical protein
MKKFLQLGVILLVFLSTIGIPVYKHSCLTKSEVSNSFYFEFTSCADEHEAHVKPACCESDKELTHTTHEQVEHTCCIDDVSNWQLPFFGFDYSSPVFYGELKTLTICDFLIADYHLEEQQIRDFSLKNPPQLNTLERLAHLCIWRL